MHLLVVREDANALMLIVRETSENANVPQEQWPCSLQHKDVICVDHRHLPPPMKQRHCHCGLVCMCAFCVSEQRVAVACLNSDVVLECRCLTVVLHWLALCPTINAKAASWRTVVCNHGSESAPQRGRWEIPHRMFPPGKLHGVRSLRESSCDMRRRAR